MVSLHNQKGSALLVALGLLGMLTLLTIMAVKNSNTDVDLSFNHINSEKTFYIAEAGAMRAVTELNNDGSWRTGFASVPFNDGSYTVTVVDSSTDSSLADTIRVIADGWTVHARSSIELLMVPGSGNPFLGALFGDDDVEIKNSMKTDSYNSDSGSYAATQLDSFADVGSNGTIDVKNGAFIGGDVVTSQSGGASVHGGATVTGIITDAAPPQDFGAVPQSEFDWAAANNDNSTGMSGTYSYNPTTKSLEVSKGTLTLSSGTYYFSTITLKKSAALAVAPNADVTVYVTGDMEIKNSGDINSGGDPGDLKFYSQGDLVLKNSGEIKAVFYNPNGEADMRNSADFYGAIVARQIVAHNSADFHYDRALAGLQLPGTGGINLVAWREL